MYVFCFDLYIFLQVSEGLVLRDGTRLKYPINGIVGFGGGQQYAFTIFSSKT